MTTTIHTATPVSAYRWQVEEHIPDSLGSFISQVRIEMELGTDVIAIFHGNELVGGWMRDYDGYAFAYELIRPENSIAIGVMRRTLTGLY